MAPLLWRTFKRFKEAVHSMFLPAQELFAFKRWYPPS
jgi:hypothetical protein